MLGSVISSTITNRFITLNSGIYLNPLTITNLGAVIDTVGLGNAILVPAGLTAAVIMNDGKIVAPSEPGFAGVFAHSALDLTNHGSIIGRYGVDLAAGGTLNNSGFISGSNTGLLIGADTAGNQIELINSGTIEGGTIGNAAAIMSTAEGVSLIVTNSSIGRIVAEGGVNLSTGGTLINSGYIFGQGYGAVASQISNSGTIIAGVKVTGSVTNSSTGTIVAGQFDVSGVTIVNQGLISSTDAGDAVNASNIYNSGRIIDGVRVTGRLTNSSTGTVISEKNDVVGTGGTFVNQGVITSTNGFGIFLNFISLPTEIVNSGTVSGGIYAADKYGAYPTIGGGSIAITNSGYIHAKSDAVYLRAGTITNSGTIAGSIAVEGRGIIVAVDPGAVFTGTAEDLSNVGTLDLLGTTTATLTGIGTQFLGFKAIEFAHASHWTVEGNAAGFGSTKTRFAGFTLGDTIVIDGFVATSETYVTNGIDLSNGITAVDLNLGGNFPVNSVVVTEASGKTTITNIAVPVLTVPEMETIVAGQASAIKAVSLAETASTAGEIFMVKLSDTHGLLSATGSGITGSGTKALTISGTLAAVNADLATLKDTDAITPSDTITLTATDSNGHAAAPATMAVVVTSSPAMLTLTNPTTGAAAAKAGLLGPPHGVAALEILLNSADFAYLLKEGLSGLSLATGTGVIPRLEMAAFSVLGSTLSAIGSLSTTH